jgi:beta-glucosidase
MVLINGGAVALAGTENRADAIVEAWYAGEYGGQAIAEVLFGDVNPGGKLPETFYASTRQLPPMSDYDLVNHPRTYLYLDQPVLYPFGHGLSYTQFGYRNLKMNADTVGVNGEVELQFTVQNTGAFQGDEVAQVYVRAADASIKAPVHQLKRFQRITLATGESTTLSFRIPASELSFYDTRTNDFKTEPGKWEIRVGGSSKDIRLKHTIVVE